jgi:ABC-type amino acid transport system permease subunit
VPFFRNTPLLFTILWIFIISPYFQMDICKDLRRLRSSRSVRLYNMPTLAMKGCAEILMPVLGRTFNLNLTQHYLPTIRKQVADVPVSKQVLHCLC